MKRRKIKKTSISEERSRVAFSGEIGGELAVSALVPVEHFTHLSPARSASPESQFSIRSQNPRNSQPDSRVWLLARLRWDREREREESSLLQLQGI